MEFHACPGELKASFVLVDSLIGIGRPMIRHFDVRGVQGCNGGYRDDQMCKHFV